MKLRIKGNSIRYRLTKSEVEKFSVTGYLEERTLFGKNIFVYALQSKVNSDELSANFENGKITVHVPKQLTEDWALNDVIGFDKNVKINDEEKLYILIEKDFKCLDETGEDQSDNYENPNKICGE